MKKLLSLISLLFAMTAISGSALSGSQDRNGNQGVKDRFVGAWRLVSLEAPGPDGKIDNADLEKLELELRNLLCL